MKIFFSLEGGFAHLPGLARPREIDTAQLPESDARALMALLSSTHLLERPQVSPRSARDVRTYTITVIDGDRAQTVQLSDPIGDSALEGLIGLLRRLTQIPRPPRVHSRIASRTALARHNTDSGSFLKN